MKTATARHLDCNESDIRVSIDRKTLVVNTFRKFIVSDDDVGPTLISLAKARRLKADAAPGDEVTFFGYDAAGNFLSSQTVAALIGDSEGCGLTAALSPRVERRYL